MDHDIWARFLRVQVPWRNHWEAQPRRKKNKIRKKELNCAEGDGKRKDGKNREEERQRHLGWKKKTISCYRRWRKEELSKFLVRALLMDVASKWYKCSDGLGWAGLDGHQTNGTSSLQACCLYPCDAIEEPTLMVTIHGLPPLWVPLMDKNQITTTI